MQSKVLLGLAAVIVLFAANLYSLSDISASLILGLGLITMAVAEIAQYRRLRGYLEADPEVERRYMTLTLVPYVVVTVVSVPLPLAGLDLELVRDLLWIGVAVAFAVIGLAQFLRYRLIGRIERPGR